MALLELKLEGYQDTVKIGDKEYLLAPYESFSISELHRFSKEAIQIGELGKNMTDEGMITFEKFFDEWFEKIAVGIPKDIKKKLMHGSRMELVNKYFLSLTERLGEQIKEVSKSGQPKVSRRSAGSTRASKSKNG